MNRISTAILAGLLVLAPAASFAKNKQATSEMPAQPMTRIEREVRHELVMLPFYGVFDNLSFRVDGGNVTLMGQVTRPTLKSSAEKVVGGVDGVTGVTNKIEVLPPSSMDDRIRMAAFRTIYGQSQLNMYAMRAVPPIHIIVRNGSITLEGVVANESDKNLAGIQANSVPGTFAVTNNLRVEQPSEK